MRPDPFLFSNALAGPPPAAHPAGRLAGTPASTGSEAPGPHHLSGSEVDESVDEPKRIRWAVGGLAIVAVLIASGIVVAAIGLLAAVLFLGAVTAAHAIGAVLALLIAAGV